MGQRSAHKRIGRWPSRCWSPHTELPLNLDLARVLPEDAEGDLD
jgi:hypothetical protein